MGKSSCILLAGIDFLFMSRPLLLGLESHSLCSPKTPHGIHSKRCRPTTPLCIRALKSDFSTSQIRIFTLRHGRGNLFYLFDPRSKAYATILSVVVVASNIHPLSSMIKLVDTLSTVLCDGRLEESSRAPCDVFRLTRILSLVQRCSSCGKVYSIEVMFTEFDFDMVPPK